MPDENIFINDSTIWVDKFNFVTLGHNDTHIYKFNTLTKQWQMYQGFETENIIKIESTDHSP